MGLNDWIRKKAGFEGFHLKRRKKRSTSKTLPLDDASACGEDKVRKFYRKNWESMKRLQAAALEWNKKTAGITAKAGPTEKGQVDNDKEKAEEGPGVQQNPGGRIGGVRGVGGQEKDTVTIEMEESVCSSSGGQSTSLSQMPHKPPAGSLIKEGIDAVRSDYASSRTEPAAEDGGDTTAEKVVVVCESSCHENESGDHHGAEAARKAEECDAPRMVGRFVSPMSEGFLRFPMPANFSSVNTDGLNLSEIGFRRVGRRRRLLVSTSMGSLPSFGRRLSPSASRTSVRTERIGKKQGFNLFLRAKSQRERDVAMARRSRAQTYGTMHQHWSRRRGQTTAGASACRNEIGGGWGKGSNSTAIDRGKARGGWGWVLLESWMLDRPWRNRYFRDPNDPTGMYLMEWIPPDQLPVPRALRAPSRSIPNRRHSSSGCSVVGGSGQGGQDALSLVGASHTLPVGDDALPRHNQSEKTNVGEHSGRSASRSDPPSHLSVGASSEASTAMASISPGTEKDSTSGLGMPEPGLLQAPVSDGQHAQVPPTSTAASLTKEAVQCIEEMSGDGRSCGITAEKAAAKVVGSQDQWSSGRPCAVYRVREGEGDACNQGHGCRPGNGKTSQTAGITDIQCTSEDQVGNKEGCGGKSVYSIRVNDGLAVSRKLAPSLDPFRIPVALDCISSHTGAYRETHSGVNVQEHEESPIVACTVEADVESEPMFRRVLAKPLWRSKSITKSNDSSGLRLSGSGSSVSSGISPYHSSENLFQKAAAQEAESSADSMVPSSDNPTETCGASSTAPITKQHTEVNQRCMIATPQISGNEPAAVAKPKDSGALEVVPKPGTGEGEISSVCQGGAIHADGKEKGKLAGSVVCGSSSGRCGTGVQKVGSKDVGSRRKTKKKKEDGENLSEQAVATKRVLPEFQIRSSVVESLTVEKVDTTVDESGGVSQDEDKPASSSSSPIADRGEVPPVSAVVSSSLMATSSVSCYHSSESARKTHDPVNGVLMPQTTLTSGGPTVVEPSAAVILAGTEDDCCSSTGANCKRNSGTIVSREEDKRDSCEQMCGKDKPDASSKAGFLSAQGEHLPALSCVVRAKGERVRAAADKLQEGGKVDLGSGNVSRRLSDKLPEGTKVDVGNGSVGRRHSLPATRLPPMKNVRKQVLSFGESSLCTGNVAVGKEEVVPTAEGGHTLSSCEEQADPPCLPSDASPERRKLSSPVRSISPNLASPVRSISSNLKPTNKYDVARGGSSQQSSLGFQRSFAGRPVSAGPAVGMRRFSDVTGDSTQRKTRADTETSTSKKIPKVWQSIATYIPSSSGLSHKQSIPTVKVTDDDLRASTQRLAAAWHVPMAKLSVSASTSLVPCMPSKSSIKSATNSSAMTATSITTPLRQRFAIHGQTKPKAGGHSADAARAQSTHIPLPSNVKISVLHHSDPVRELEGRRRSSAGTRLPVLMSMEEQTATSANDPVMGAGVTKSNLRHSSPSKQSERGPQSECNPQPECNPQNVILSGVNADCYTPAAPNETAQLDRVLMPLMQLGVSPGSESPGPADPSGIHSTESQSHHPQSQSSLSSHVVGVRMSSQLCTTLLGQPAMLEVVTNATDYVDATAKEKPWITRDLTNLFDRVSRGVCNEGQPGAKAPSVVAESVTKEDNAEVTVLKRASARLPEPRDRYSAVAGLGDHDDDDDDTVVQQLSEGEKGDLEAEEVTSSSANGGASGGGPREELLQGGGVQSRAKKATVTTASASRALTNPTLRHRSSPRAHNPSASVDTISRNVRASISSQKGELNKEQEEAKSKVPSGLSARIPDPASCSPSAPGRSLTGAHSAAKGKDAFVGKQQRLSTPVRSSVKLSRNVEVEAQSQTQDEKQQQSRVPSRPQVVKKAGKVTAAASSSRANVSEDALAAVRLSLQRCAAACQASGGSKSKSPTHENSRTSVSSQGAKETGNTLLTGAQGLVETTRDAMFRQQIEHHLDGGREVGAEPKVDDVQNSHVIEGVRESDDSVWNGRTMAITVGARGSGRILDSCERRDSESQASTPLSLNEPQRVFLCQTMDGGGRGGEGKGAGQTGWEEMCDDSDEVEVIATSEVDKRESIDSPKCNTSESSGKATRGGLKKPAVSRVYDHLSDVSRARLRECHPSSTARKPERASGTMAGRSKSKPDAQSGGLLHQRSSPSPSVSRPLPPSRPTGSAKKPLQEKVVMQGQGSSIKGACERGCRESKGSAEEMLAGFEGHEAASLEGKGVMASDTHLSAPHHSRTADVNTGQGKPDSASNRNIRYGTTTPSQQRAANCSASSTRGSLIPLPSLPARESSRRPLSGRG